MTAPSLRTDFFETLWGLLRVPATGTRSHLPVIAQRLMLALAATLCLALLAPGAASASFTRPFLHAVTGTPSGPFTVPLGVATDAEDRLWVSDRIGVHPYTPPFQLDGFGSAEPGHENLFLESLEIEGSPNEPYGLTPPESLAIGRSTGSFYTTGGVTTNNFNAPSVEVFAQNGTFVNRFGPFRAPAHLAIDNSIEPTDSSAGSLYVATEEGLERFNLNGEQVEFTRSEPYIEGNRITGTPTGSGGCENGHFNFFSRLGSIALDPEGNIYVLDRECMTSTPALIEYRPSGEFVRVLLTGAETPGLGGSHELGGFGGRPEAIAFDPVSEHMLVSVTSGEEGGGNEGAVDEFDSSGHYLNQITETTEGTPLRGAFQMTVDSHGDLYLVDQHEHVVDVYGPGHFLPSVRLGQTSDRTPTSAIVNGSVDAGELALSGCHFEWVTEVAFEATGFSDLSTGGEAPCVPPAGSIPADSKYHAVHAEATDLTSGAVYRYRLLATTEGALGGTAATHSLPFTAPAKPRVDSTTAANLSSTFVDLHAEINPLGADTHYHFEYVTQAQFEVNGFSEPFTTPEVDIGSGGATGSVDASVVQHVGGLKPSTTYHFRAIATNLVGTTEGPDSTFATLPQVVPGLSDGRAYELLTPSNKGSAEDMFAHPASNGEFTNADVGVASDSGDQFLLQTTASFGPFPASEGNAYVFSRASGGWAYTSFASPSLGIQGIANPLFNPADLSRFGFADGVGSQVDESGTRLVSLVGTPGGPYTTIHADVNKEEETRPVGASSDLSHIVLESRSHTLVTGAESQDPGSHSLYEWSAGELKLLNVTSKGALLNRCGAVLGQDGANAGKTHNAVSADGSRVFFTAPDPQKKSSKPEPGCWDGATTNAPQVYQRSGTTTTQVSAPEAGVSDPTGRHSATYVGAAEDGSRVFFLAETELTKDDAAIHDPELYEWRSPGTVGAEGAAPAAPCAESSPNYVTVSKGCLARISAGESGHAAAAVFTVPVVSAQGSAVYFTALGQLTSDAPATSGEEANLYRYETATAATTYVATINRSDWGSNGTQGIGLSTDANWYTSPDGRYLLFASTAELTGYSTVTAPGATCRVPDRQGESNGHCTELYRYDAATPSSLICVSCNPTGAPPTSNARFDRSPFDSPAAGTMRAMSDDGSYVFFDTADALVPQDANGTLDVYEWHEGKVSLISSGHDSAPSFFLGTSADGSNVFFGTHARLVPADTDTAGDLYDARICTANDPCVKPPPSHEGECEGDACSHPVPAPNDSTPASLSFQGAGNVREGVLKPRCAKGKVRSHGRCLKKHHKAKHKRVGANRGGRR